MSKTVNIIFLLVCCVACTASKGISESQGISGEVRWVEGNLMPSVEDTTLSIRYKGVPVERFIYIFKAVKRADVISAGGSIFKKVNAPLLGRIKTNKKGNFKIELPPGNYSVFVMEEEGYFANIFDGENYVNPITVQDNKFTEVQILVNYKAFY